MKVRFPACLTDRFDLDAYLARLGISTALTATVDDLARLQWAHRLAIPFESLDIHLGHGISLAPDAIFAKLVTARRGGYCFEQNSLFARALGAIGFAVRPLLARVWLGDPVAIPPRTHTLLLVTIGGREWIADAGFGASYYDPMPLAADGASPGPDGSQAILTRHPEHGWWLSRRQDGTDSPMYSFTTDPVYDADLALSNHWTATSPESRFVRNVIVSRVVPTGQIALTNQQLSRVTSDGTTRCDITDRATLHACLADDFGIFLSAGAIAKLPLFAEDRPA